MSAVPKKMAEVEGKIKQQLDQVERLKSELARNSDSMAFDAITQCLYFHFDGHVPPSSPAEFICMLRMPLMRSGYVKMPMVPGVLPENFFVYLKIVEIVSRRFPSHHVWWFAYSGYNIEVGSFISPEGVEVSTETSANGSPSLRAIDVCVWTVPKDASQEVVEAEWMKFKEEWQKNTNSCVYFDAPILQRPVTVTLGEAVQEYAIHRNKELSKILDSTGFWKPRTFEEQIEAKKEK